MLLSRRQTRLGPEQAPFLPARLASLGFLAWRVGKTDVILPPMATIPRGSFLMGSSFLPDFTGASQEWPILVETYRISVYPVTVAEWACAVRARVVREPPNSYMDGEGHAYPVDSGKRGSWNMQQYQPDHPIVRISWKEATAYAHWLRRLTGQPWRLPTEAEWEKAARGTDGRLYPWGNQWDAHKIPVWKAGSEEETTPVGACTEHGDASPYGCHDMVGNVHEFCHSLFRPYPYNRDDGREQQRRRVRTITDTRVVRSGSWHFANEMFCCAAFRSHIGPDVRKDDQGFRLVCGVSSSPD